jgi:transcriptional regulator of acetoin/glycerol metabolism
MVKQAKQHFSTDSTKEIRQEMKIVNCIASPTYNLAKHLAGLLGVFVGQPDHTKKSGTYV